MAIVDFEVLMSTRYWLRKYYILFQIKDKFKLCLTVTLSYRLTSSRWSAAFCCQSFHDHVPASDSISRSRTRKQLLVASFSAIAMTRGEQLQFDYRFDARTIPGNRDAGLLAPASVTPPVTSVTCLLCSLLFTFVGTFHNTSKSLPSSG